MNFVTFLGWFRYLKLDGLPYRHWSFVKNAFFRQVSELVFTHYQCYDRCLSTFAVSFSIVARSCVQIFVCICVLVVSHIRCINWNYSFYNLVNTHCCLTSIKRSITTIQRKRGERERKKLQFFPENVDTFIPNKHNIIF